MTTGRPHPSRPAARQGGARHGRSQPPRRPPACLPRRALAERVRAALEGRLLRVVASVGHGKSTLLALATEELDAPVVWCADMGAGGRAPPRAVVPALASLIPGLRPDPILAAPPSRRVDLLCEEVERRAPRDVVVVLDDVVGPGARGAPTDLRRLVAGLPDSVHLALLARAELPGELGLPRPDAVDLDEAELALTPAEAEELLDLLAPEGDLAARDELVRTAEGWAAGLVIGARGGDPGRYLEAEVLAHEDEAAAGLLDEASPLERFTPDMAVEVTGRRDAAVTLAGLVRRHAFVTLESHGLDGDWHRMHPMMRALCGRRLERRSRADTARLHRRAAEAWLRLGRPEEAARHHLGAGDVAAALSALAPLGSPGADEQRRGVVAACLDAVPPELWSDTSGIVLVHASTLFYRADYVGAFEAMESAVELLLGQGEHERAAATLTRLLRAVPLAGGLHERGVATARRLIPRIRDSAAMLPAARVVLGLLLAELARYSEAERELSMVLIGDSGSGLSLDAVQAGVVRAFAIDHSLGRRAEAVAAIDEAIPVLAAAGADDRLHHLLYARGFRSIVLADGGRFEEALQEGERLRAAAAERGLARLASPVVAMLRFGPLAGLERWDVLESELVRAAPLFDRLAGTLRGYRYHVAAAQLAAARGDAEAVRTAVDGARAALAVHGHPYDTAMVQADLARAAFDTGLRELARTQADEARRQAEHARAPWAATRAAMVSAHVLGPGAGDSALADALARSRAPRMVTLWTERERSLALTLLPRALGAGLGPPGVATALAAACGGEVLAACAGSLDRAPPEVREALARAARRADDAEPALDRLVRDSDAGPGRAPGSS